MTASRHIRDRTPIEAFFSLVCVKHGCWEWLGPRQASGHGYWTKNGLRDKAHRWSYRLHFGEPPPGKFICHTCDNPSCVNPGHLYAGTHLENMRDMRERGRAARPIGEKHPGARLTESDVAAIRSLHGAGETQRSLAKRFGVAPSTISMAVRGANWGHVK